MIQTIEKSKRYSINTCLVNYADPKGNTKMRRGDAICANSLVQSFSPKTTGRKRTIKKSKK